jgi:GntR family transcriptional regulator/GntR family frlABCD operon transcriptional regulator
MLKSLPRYRKLHEDIKQDILLGEIPEGSLLPSENELSSKYKITRSTVRQGLQELVKEGFIEKRTGIGSVVVSDRKTLGLLSFKGFSEVLKSTSLSSATLIFEPIACAEWPSPFFYELSSMEKAVDCFSLGRLRTVEKNPVMLEFTYIPQLGLVDFPEKLRQNSLFKLLQVHYKIEVVQVMQDVRAIIGQENILGPLQLKTGDPVLEIHRKYITNKDGFHIYSRLYCNTKNYTISNFFN